MKKATLLLFAALLLFTAACSGGGEGTTTSDTTTAATTTAATTAATTATTATTAAPAIIPTDIPPVTVDLIAEGYPLDNEYHEESDYPYLSQGAMLFVEEVNRYYFFVGYYLMYADAQTMETAFLCNKEGCLHNEGETKEEKMACEAFFYNSFNGGLFAENGRLYFTHNPEDRSSFSLSSLTLDGEDLREEFCLDVEYRSSQPGGSCIFHRGQLYYTWLQIDDAKNYTAELWTYSLDKSTQGHRLLYQSQNTRNGFTPLVLQCAYGHHLYLREYIQLLEEYTAEHNGNASSRRLEHCVELILDLTTGEWTVTEMPDGYTYDSIEILDGKVLSKFISMDSIRAEADIWKTNIESEQKVEFPEPEYIMYVYNPATGQSEELNEYPTDYSFWEYRFDEKYGYRYEHVKPDFQESMLYICDLNGQSIAEVPFSNIYGYPAEIDGTLVDVDISYGSCTMFLQPTSKTILYTYEVGETEKDGSFARETYYYIDLADMQGSEIEAHKFFECKPSDYNVD